MNLTMAEKLELINRYGDQEQIFNYCGFNTGDKKPKNPYRNDKHSGSCNWKWHNGILFFFDWTYPFDSGTKKHITIYGAVNLFNGFTTNVEAINWIIDKFIYGLAESEKQDKARLIASKKKIKSIPDEIKIDFKGKSFSGINYWTNYFIYNHDLTRENIFNVRSYEVIKNGNDITKYFPTIKEAQGLIIAYKYKDRTKFYVPHPITALKKPRFWGNINSASCIEGQEQLKNPRNKTAIILGSKKDYMVCRYPLHSLDADFYATQNEGNYLPDWFLKALNNKYQNIYTLFDNDEAGLKAGTRIVTQQELTGQIILPNIYSGEKLLKDPAAIIYYLKKEKTINTIKNSNIITYDELKNKSTHEIDPTTWEDLQI